MRRHIAFMLSYSQLQPAMPLAFSERHFSYSFSLLISFHYATFLLPHFFIDSFHFISRHYARLY